MAGDAKPKRPAISRLELAALLMLLAAALALRVAGAWADYPWCWYPDRDVVIHARNCINPNAPKLSPGEYIYPTGYIYLNAAVYALIGAAMAPFIGVKGVAAIYYGQVGFLAAVTRIVGSLLACGTIALVWWLGQELFGRLAGWLAAAALAVAWLDVVCCHYPTTDAPAAFMLAATVAWALRIYSSGPNARSMAIGGALAGAAAATKYPAGAGLIAVALAAAMSSRSSSDCPVEGPGGTRCRPGPMKPATAIALAVGAAAAAFLVLMPWAVLDWPNFLADMVYQSAYNAAGSEAPWQVGRFWLWAQPPAGMGWPLNLLSLGGLAALLVCAPRRSAVVLAPAATVFVALVATTRFIPRWYELLMPFAALGAGVGLAAAVAPAWSRGRVGRALSAIAIVACFALPLAFVIWYDALVTASASRREAKTWADANISPGARVALLQWLWAGPALAEERYQLTWLIPGSLERMVAAQRLDAMLGGRVGAALRRLSPRGYEVLRRRAAAFRQGAGGVADLMPPLPDQQWVVVNETYWSRLVCVDAVQPLVRRYHSELRRYWTKLQGLLGRGYVVRASFGRLAPAHPWDEYPYGDPRIIIYERRAPDLKHGPPGRSAALAACPPR